MPTTSIYMQAAVALATAGCVLAPIEALNFNIDKLLYQRRVEFEESRKQMPFKEPQGMHDPFTPMAPRSRPDVWHCGGECCTMHSRSFSPYFTQWIREIEDDRRTLKDVEHEADKNAKRIAVEIMGCLRTLNSSKVVNSFQRAIATLNTLEWKVDLFAVVEECMPIEHDLAERVKELLLSLGAGGNVLVEKVAAGYNVTLSDGQLRQEFRRDFPHYKDYAAHKGKRTNINDTILQFYKLKRVKELRKGFQHTYDAVWRTRTDVVVHDIAWSEWLAAIAKDSSVWIVPSRPFWMHSITDEIAFLSEPAADRYDDLYCQIDALFSVQKIIFHPESLLHAHMLGKSRFHTHLKCRMVQGPINKICREDGCKKQPNHTDLLLKECPFLTR